MESQNLHLLKKHVFFCEKIQVLARTYLQSHYDDEVFGNICVPFSWTTLRDKHCWHPIAVMGVVDRSEQVPVHVSLKMYKLDHV